MADATSMALLDLVRTAAAGPDVDVLRDALGVLRQALMAAEVEAHVGAGWPERSAERTGQRNGYRERTWDTRVDSLEVRVPRLRDGSQVPAPASAPPRRAGADGGDPGGGCAGRGHLPRGRARGGVGEERRQQVPGEPALPGVGRGGGALPQPAPGRAIAVHPAGRHLRHGAPRGGSWRWRS
jgi:hypothetical protein